MVPCFLTIDVLYSSKRKMGYFQYDSTHDHFSDFCFMTSDSSLILCPYDYYSVIHSRPCSRYKNVNFSFVDSVFRNHQIQKPLSSSYSLNKPCRTLKMTTNFNENAAIAAANQYRWKATNIHQRDKPIVDGQVYEANQGTLIVFLELSDGFGRKCNPLTSGVPAGLDKVKYLITPAGGQAEVRDLVVGAGADLSNVQIDTKGLSGAYTIQLLGHTFYLQVGPPIQSPPPVVHARPRRPPTGPTGNA